MDRKWCFISRETECYALCPCEFIPPSPSLLHTHTHTHFLSLFPAQNYLMGTKHPLVPVTCLAEGKETEKFNAVFSS